jgi:hypothetical protein
MSAGPGHSGVVATSDEYPRQGGRARRLIDLRRWDEHTVVGWLEDDFHHFGVSVLHKDDRVVEVRTVARRYPYSTCGGAALPVQALMGAPLIRRASDIGGLIDMRLQCTHVFDLAGLVLAHAASGRTHRRYEATVEDREIVHWEEPQRRKLGPGSAALHQDGMLVLAWQMDGYLITAPEEWAGQSLREGFRDRTEALEVEAAEHATILRRTIMIAGGRSADRAKMQLPGERTLPAVCHTFQPGQRERAQWMADSIRNYQASGDGMLADVDTKP